MRTMLVVPCGETNQLAANCIPFYGYQDASRALVLQRFDHSFHHCDAAVFANSTVAKFDSVAFRPTSKRVDIEVRLHRDVSVALEMRRVDHDVAGDEQPGTAL